MIPQPEHFALAGTLLVHPSTTTRAKSAERKEAANVALRFLRLASALVSPMDSKLSLAFAFGRSKASRSGRRLRAGDEEDDGMVKWKGLDVANESSLWSRAEDFWHAVGWAFNCSVLHPERWERWHVWLQYMCDVLLDDWEDRRRKYDAMQRKKEGEGQPDEGNSLKKDDGLDLFRESMIFQYIAADFTHGRNRRIIRAIFADGSSNSVNGFRQVFDKELQLSQSEKEAKKATKRDRDVNIDREEYGDYLSQDESEEEGGGTTDSSIPNSRADSPAGGARSRRTKRTRRGTRNAADPTSAQSVGDQAATDATPHTHTSGGVSPMGGLNSLALRKRLLNLISAVSERLPSDFMPVHDLYPLLVENIRPLPLPLFQAFVSPYVLPQFSDEAQTTLCELLLFYMRESSAPATEEEYLNQAKLERCFLPFAAASASTADNTKVSILLEAVIMLLASSNMLSATPSFKQALETGILRRAVRAQEDMRRSQASRDKESLEWCWLVESGDRLNYLVELLSG